MNDKQFKVFIAETLIFAFLGGEIGIAVFDNGFIAIFRRYGNGKQK